MIGMYAVVHRLRTTVVTPLVAESLGDPRVIAPRQVLIYGPPKCGVSFIAERLATEIRDLASITVGVVSARNGEVVNLDRRIDAAARDHTVVIAAIDDPWELDPTIYAEFDRRCFVHPPDWEARRFRVWESPIGRRVDSEELDEIVVATEGWCGEDIASMFAAASTIDEALDLAVDDLGPVTDDWITQAAAFAHASDSSAGLDDLIAYLQRIRRY